MARGRFRERIRDAVGGITDFVTDPIDTAINVVDRVIPGEQPFLQTVQDFTPSMNPVETITDIVPYVPRAIDTATDLVEPEIIPWNNIPVGPGPLDTIGNIVDTVTTVKDLVDTVTPIVKPIYNSFFDSGESTGPTTGLPGDVFPVPGTPITTVPCATAPKDCYARCREADKQRNTVCSMLNREHEKRMATYGCPGTQCKSKKLGKSCSVKPTRRSKRISKYKKSCSCKR